MVFANFQRKRRLEERGRGRHFGDLGRVHPPGCPVTGAPLHWRPYRSWLWLPFVLFALGSGRAEDLLNLDFGSGSESSMVGPAAVGQGTNDVWNFYSATDADGTPQISGAVTNLEWASGEASGAGVEVTNVWGAWETGAADPMLNGYIYSVRGQTLGVTLTNLPPGVYDVWIYGHGISDKENSGFELDSGDRNFDLGETVAATDWAVGGWAEGRQFVSSHGVVVRPGDDLVLTVRPGAAGFGVLNGLQLLRLYPLPEPAEASAAGDFSMISNPHGVWSFGWFSPGSTEFQVFTNSFVTDEGFQVWNANLPQELGLPGVFFNPSALEISTPSFTAAPKQFWVVPGVNGERAVVRWTAPEPGLVRVDTVFAGLVDAVGPTTDLRVSLGDELMFEGRLGLATNQSSWSTNLFVHAGDLLTAEVGDGGNGNYEDETAMNFDVQYLGADLPPDLLVVQPGGGIFTNEVTVELDSSVANGEIRYTLNDTPPNDQSMVYTGPLALTNSVVLRGRLFFDGTPYTAPVSSEFDLALEDGIPPSWRAQFFGAHYYLDPRIAALADPDGDGASNLQEYLGGTDPLNASSVPEVPIGVGTYAGGGAPGTNGFRLEAGFDVPTSVSVGPQGDLWISEGGIAADATPGPGGHRLRMIDTNGVVSTLAGGAEPGLEDGPGADARFSAPGPVVFDSSGNAFVADQLNQRIREIDPAGNVTTFAGSTAGFADGAGTNAQFDLPSGLAIDATNRLYVADAGNNRIRQITPDGQVTTLAGGTAGDSDGDAAQARFNDPTDLALGPSGNLFIADRGNGKIRVLRTDGRVTTFAAGLTGLRSLEVDVDGGLYVTEPDKRRLIKYRPDGTQQWVFAPPAGFQDGLASDAQFGIMGKPALLGGGNLLVPDMTNRRLRLLETGPYPVFLITPFLDAFTNSLTLSVWKAFPEAEVHFTMDGSPPDLNSPVWDQPLAVTNTTLLRTRAFVHGYAVSPIQDRSFERLDGFDATIGDITLDPQTGLFEQTVTVTNRGTIDLPGLQIIIDGVPEGVEVYNASGQEDGHFVVEDSQPLAPAGEVTLTVQYFSPTREAPAPTLAVEAVQKPAAPPSDATVIAIAPEHQAEAGGVVIRVEFNSIAGTTYYVQYSADGVQWKTAGPPITAAGTKVQWVDTGPPKTPKAPSQADQRFYRVLRVVKGQ